jgi:methylenetetrahydrofolate reductase (NADPH)
MRLKGIALPALGTVFQLGAQSARAFNRWAVPGVCVPDSLLATVDKQAASPDKGRRFFTEFAAKQVAVLRGLGYRGAHLSGRPDFDRVSGILEMERSFSPDDWKSFAREIQFPQPREFYYFERDRATDISSDRVNADYLASRASTAYLKRFMAAPSFHLGRAAHRLLLADRAPAAGAARVFYRTMEKSKHLTAANHTAERLIKLPLYGCRDCGDCSLPELAYLCPESQCAKNQRNGPCGGTRAGRCEVLDKDCIWLRAYDRLKIYGQEEHMLDRPPVMIDASLRGTSSWANALLGRDHTAKARANAKSD